MSIVVADFETFYDADFSLSKLSLEAYIRDPRFEVIGVSAKIDNEPVQWFSGTMLDTQRWLENLCDWDDAIFVAHNAQFDAFIMVDRFKIKPKAYLDTQAMAVILHGLSEQTGLKNMSEFYNIGVKGDEVIRAIGKRRVDFSGAELKAYASYCMNDTDLTAKLAKKMLSLLPPVELDLINITTRMYCEPVLVLDRPLLEKHLLEVKAAKETLMLDLWEKMSPEQDGEDFDFDALKKLLMSNDKFAATLRHLGVEPPMKVSPTTGEPTYAFAKTDEGMKELEDYPDATVQALVAARLGNKSTIDETRTQRFIDISKRGTFPFPVKYSGAKVTHRWAGTDRINPQNLSRINKKKPKPSDALRNSIMAPSGYMIVAGDLSNIELRMALWVAGEDEDLNKIRAGRDLYRASAEDIAGVPYDEVDDDLRFVFKTVNLSGIYGVGYEKMHNTFKQAGVDKTLQEVLDIVTKYRQRHRHLVSTWGEGEQVLSAISQNQTKAMGVRRDIIAEGEKGIRKPSGLYLPFPGLCRRMFKGKENWVYFKREGKSSVAEGVYGAKCFQRTIQSMSRDLIGWQMVQIDKRFPIVGTVHDEAITICLEEEVDECVAYMTECLSMGPDWAKGLPLACDVGVGKRYGDC